MAKSEQGATSSEITDLPESVKIKNFLEKCVYPYTDNPLIRAALERWSRASFVDSSFLEYIWTDSIIPIEGAAMSQPSLVVRMMDHLQLDGTGTVMEVGTGSGWLALLLADCAENVHTIELVQQLSTNAEKILRSLGNTSVRFHVGDGALGLPIHAPFQRIIVTAAAQTLPLELVRQLDAKGGKMVVPVGENYEHCTLIEVTRNDTEIAVRNIEPVRFMPLMSDVGNGAFTQKQYDEVTRKNEQTLADLVNDIAEEEDLDVSNLRQQVRDAMGDLLSDAQVNRHVLAALEEMGVVDHYFLHKMSQPRVD